MVVVSMTVVVELPQMPEGDAQKRLSCAWRVDKLITIGACV